VTEQEAQGIAGVARDLGSKVILSLPAQFLVLVILNTAFLGGLLWFLNEQNKARERLLTPIVTSCVQQVPGDIMAKLLEAVRPR